MLNPEHVLAGAGEGIGILVVDENVDLDLLAQTIAEPRRDGQQA
jgi:hypothetical protein